MVRLKKKAIAAYTNSKPVARKVLQLSVFCNCFSSQCEFFLGFGFGIVSTVTALYFNTAWKCLGCFGFPAHSLFIHSTNHKVPRYQAVHLDLLNIWKARMHQNKPRVVSAYDFRLVRAHWPVVHTIGFWNSYSIIDRDQML